MRNFKMLLAYDGTRYQGWQRLSGNDNTIQGKLETALSRLLDQEVTVSGSGRTDAGTHARGQVASFHADTTLSPAALLRQLLPERFAYPVQEKQCRYSLPAYVRTRRVPAKPCRYYAEGVRS